MSTLFVQDCPFELLVKLLKKSHSQNTAFPRHKRKTWQSNCDKIHGLSCKKRHTKNRLTALEPTGVGQGLKVVLFDRHLALNSNEAPYYKSINCTVKKIITELR